MRHAVLHCARGWFSALREFKLPVVVDANHHYLSFERRAQILHGKAYGKEVDCWSLGIILFVM